jgi:uncharacterized protein (TIGR00369 family)
MSELPALVAAARATGDYDALLAALPYARFLGLRATLVDERVRIHLPFTPQLVGNPNIQSLHGGVAGACLETAALLQLMHVASGPSLPRTIDFTIDYLRQARGDDLYADADVQRVGRRVANVRMRAYQRDPSQPVVLGRGNFLLD